MMHIRNIDWVLDLWEGNCLFYLAGGERVGCQLLFQQHAVGCHC